MNKKTTLLALAAIFSATFIMAAVSATVGFGDLYLNDEVVGTLVNPSNVPDGTGTAPLYSVSNGVDGQLGIAGLGPGDQGYNGGRWAFYDVTFNVDPYLLTSDEAVAMAEASGDVTVTRIEENDFRCPIQP